MMTVASHKLSLSLERDIDKFAAATAFALSSASALVVVYQRFSTVVDRGRADGERVQVELTARQALCLKWSANR
ncbi:hypothetical protein [Mesorhizobium sp. WSM3224]|uniref:hypothetical protein n=1 Tax=Mesorhizobium sp. WSM3224 TaxID=1040986 RepID=UPI000411BB08|nr:hypothetical protein [Mesorhizobium sp. WSM3224]